MLLHRLLMPIALSGPLLLGIAVAQAQESGETRTTTTSTVITTAVPAPKEMVSEPANYVSCTTVSAGWQGKAWHPEHKVCRYDTTQAAVQGEAWVSGHWQCSQYTATADTHECTNWDWSAGHWVKTYAQVQYPST